LKLIDIVFLILIVCEHSFECSIHWIWIWISLGSFVWDLWNTRGKKRNI